MPGHRSLCCLQCVWITQRDGLLPKLCDHCQSPFPADKLKAVNNPFAPDLPATGQRKGGQPTSPHTMPKSRPGSSPAPSSPSSSNTHAQLGRYIDRRWARRQPGGRSSSSAPAAQQQHRPPRRSSSVQPPRASPAPDSEAEDSSHYAQTPSPESQDLPQSQPPMQLDGNAQTHRTTLVAK